MARGRSDLQRSIVAKAGTVERLHDTISLYDYAGWRPARKLPHVSRDGSEASAPPPGGPQPLTRCTVSEEHHLTLHTSEKGG